MKATKYKKNNGSWELKWEINDFGYEVLLHFKYTKIIDIDKDGYAETLFCYQVDETKWKIMLHYKDKKYAVRSFIPQLDNDKYKCQFDDSFKTVPQSINNYVKSYWGDIINKEGLKTD